MRRGALVLLVMSMTGCSSNPAPQSSAPERPWQDITRNYAQSRLMAVPGSSLAHDLGLGMEGLSDSAIAQLLAHRLALPARVGVGALHLAAVRTQPSWYERESGFHFGSSVQDTALISLRALPRVERAALLPALLIADRPTVATIREAAARLQVDLLLVYRPSCQFFERYPFIGPVTYRASCTVETAVLDVRSGVVPFTAALLHDASDRRIDSDMETSGTIARLATAASAAALAETIERFGAALAAVPVAEAR